MVEGEASLLRLLWQKGGDCACACLLQAKHPACLSEPLTANTAIEI